jgi:hypothetical protein
MVSDTVAFSCLGHGDDVADQTSRRTSTHPSAPIAPLEELLRRLDGV